MAVSAPNFTKFTRHNFWYRTTIPNSTKRTPHINSGTEHLHQISRNSHHIIFGTELLYQISQNLRNGLVVFSGFNWSPHKPSLYITSQRLPSQSTQSLFTYVCVFVVSYMYLFYLMCICCILCVFVVPYVYLLYYVCTAVLTLDARLLADLNFLVTFFSYLCTCKITTATGW